MQDLKKPYSLNDIGRRPFTVMVSILIVLLFFSVGYNVTVNVNANQRIEEMREKMEKSHEKSEQDKDDRIEKLESVIFRLEANRQVADSAIKEKTEPLVNQIFQNGKK